MKSRCMPTRPINSVSSRSPSLPLASMLRQRTAARFPRFHRASFPHFADYVRVLQSALHNHRAAGTLPPPDSPPSTRCEEWNSPAFVREFLALYAFLVATGSDILNKLVGSQANMSPVGQTALSSCFFVFLARLLAQEKADDPIGERAVGRTKEF
jgi:hypothetical protein